MCMYVFSGDNVYVLVQFIVEEGVHSSTLNRRQITAQPSLIREDKTHFVCVCVQVCVSCLQYYPYLNNSERGRERGGKERQKTKQGEAK